MWLLYEVTTGFPYQNLEIYFKCVTCINCVVFKGTGIWKCLFFWLYLSLPIFWACSIFSPRCVWVCFQFDVPLYRPLTLHLLYLACSRLFCLKPDYYQSKKNYIFKEFNSVYNFFLISNVFSYSRDVTSPSTEVQSPPTDKHRDRRVCKPLPSFPVLHLQLWMFPRI
jgi:hypothetical protein